MHKVVLPPAYVEGAESIQPFGSKSYNKGTWVDRPWRPVGTSHYKPGEWNGSFDDAVRVMEDGS